MEGASSNGTGVTRRRLLEGAGVAAVAIATHRSKPEGEKPVTLPAGIKALDINGIQVLQSGTEGPNIIFLHNAGQVPLGMTEHICNLAEVGQVVAPNIFDLIRSLQLRGNPNPGFADIANEISRLDILDRKQKTGIVSSSMGASVAWEYSAQHPKDVVWNVAGSPTGWPLNRSMGEWMVAFVREFVLPPKVPIPKDLQTKNPGLKFWGKRVVQDPGSVWHGLKLTMKADEREAMKTINTPVELLWGETDEYIPYWSGAKMKADIFPTNGRLDVVSKFNHIWPAVEPGKLTNPAVVRARVTPRAA